MAARTSLARSATGLARYYLDCGWWRAKNFRRLPLDALGLWVCIVGACNEQGTDGRMPADPEDLAAAVGLRLSAVRKPLRTLIAHGRIVERGDEIIIVGYSDHNPTSVEIEEYTESRSRQGSRGNHVRWHTNSRKWTSDCALCIAEYPSCPAGWQDVSDDSQEDRHGDRPSDAVGSDRIEIGSKSDPKNSNSDEKRIDQNTSSSDTGEGATASQKPETPGQHASADRQGDRPGDPNTIANRSHGMGWDGMGTKQVVSPTGLGTPPPDPTTDDDTKPDLDQLTTAIARARSARLGGGHNPTWIRTTAARLNRAVIAEAISHGHTHPAELDLMLDGIRNQPPPTVHPAVAATRPDCPTCDGLHMLEQDDGSVAPCPDCTTERT